MPSGEAVTSLAIATSRKYKNKAGEMVEETEWHRVSMFGKLAEIANQYLRKGRSVYVEGRIKTDKYVDKSGVEKYSTQIIANEMVMLGGKESSGGMADMDDGGYNQAPPPPRSPSGSQRSAPASRPASSGFDDMDDDIPF
jgi:single-strand DNA-binding protein